MAGVLRKAAGRVLVSAPGLLDPNFAQTIVYICEHDREGALGFIVNRPRPVKLRSVFKGPVAAGPLGDAQVLEGGPVNAGRVGILTVLPARNRSGFTVRMLSAEDALKQRGERPDAKFFAMAGHAGWSAGQLETELAEKTWVIRQPGPEIWDMRLAPGLWPFYYDNDLAWRALIPHLPRSPFFN